MKINHSLNLSEKILFYFLLVFFTASLLWWGLSFYFSKTQAIADFGGEYIEGIVGQPLHINPLISQSNNADEDLVQLMFNGLLEYGPDGKLVSDLAESYEISEDKTRYTFHLKNNVRWHDGEAFTAADVLFTVNILSDPAYKSPLRANWQGIETAVIDDQTITFQIKSPYAGFLNNLTFGILPEHLWSTVAPEKFALTEMDLQPIGTGPFKYSSLQKDSKGNIITYKLAANPDYFAGKPYLSKITVNFYPDDDSALSAFNQKEVLGLNSLTPKKIPEIKLLQSTAVHKFSIPRYFAVFFNQTKSIPLAEDQVRSALSYATDRQEIIAEVLNDSGSPVYSPILSGMIGFTEDLDKREFNLEKAERLLEDDGWKRGEDGIRAKNAAALEINLTTTDWPELVQTAEILKSQWEKIGARVAVSSFSISDIQQNYIRPREYDALLFGQVLGGDPDPYSFWHSTNKKDPGLNLALFGDSETDKLIDDGRVEFDLEKRSALYADFQKKLATENPAVFLYSPDYVYPVNKKVQGINIKNLISPARRFAEANLWYIKTKRIWK